jgi:hypothetical protein
MTTIDLAARAVTAAGVVLLLLGVARTRQVLPSLAMAIELFLAAALIRLVAHTGVRDLVVAVALIGVRMLAATALRRANRARAAGR